MYFANAILILFRRKFETFIVLRFCSWHHQVKVQKTDADSNTYDVSF